MLKDINHREYNEFKTLVYIYIYINYLNLIKLKSFILTNYVLCSLFSHILIVLSSIDCIYLIKNKNNN